MASKRNPKVAHFMLTFAQCDLDPREMLTTLRDHTCLTGNIAYMCVAEEDHHDTQGVHRHIFVKLCEERRFNKDDIAWRFDLIRITTGNEYAYRSWEDFRTLWLLEDVDEPPCGFEVANILSDADSTIRRWHPHFRIPCKEKDDEGLVMPHPKNLWSYTRKDGKFIEYGHSPFRETSKTTSEQAERNRILLQTPISELLAKGLISAMALPQLQKSRAIYRQYERKENASYEIEVLWFYGPTGSGKTFEARRYLQEKYGEDWWESTGDGKSSAGWFDSYEGEKGVHFEEFRAGALPWQTVLRLTQWNPKLLLPAKGAFIRWCPRTIIFSSPNRPDEVFRYGEDRALWDNTDQLYRRLGGKLTRFWKDDEGYHHEVEDIN